MPCSLFAACLALHHVMAKRLAAIIVSIAGLVALIVMGVYYRSRAPGNADARVPAKPAVEPVAPAPKHIDAGTNTLPTTTAPTPTMTATVAVPSATFTMGAPGEAGCARRS